MADCGKNAFLRSYFFGRRSPAFGTESRDQKGWSIMSMIKAEHLTFSYPGSFDTIFEDVSFTIDTDWKLGFVGRNGRGKTTFLNMNIAEPLYRPYRLIIFRIRLRIRAEGPKKF